MDTQKTGEFIKTLRKENNLTQIQLAEKLSCTDKAISRWETGKGLPDADMLLSLSDIFSVSINEILLGERFTFKVTDNETPVAVAESQKIEEIISVTDETIVNIIKDKEKKIDSVNKSAVMVIATCCIQALIFFVIPDILTQFRPYAEPIVFVIYASLLNFTFAGFIRDKSKWLFPLFTVICLLAPMVIDTSEAHLNIWFAFLFGVTAAGIMGIASALKFIINKILKKP